MIRTAFAAIMIGALAASPLYAGNNGDMFDGVQNDNPAGRADMMLSPTQPVPGNDLFRPQFSSIPHQDMFTQPQAFAPTGDMFGRTPITPNPGIEGHFRAHLDQATPAGALFRDPNQSDSP